MCLCQFCYCVRCLEGIKKRDTIEWGLDIVLRERSSIFLFSCFSSCAAHLEAFAKTWGDKLKVYSFWGVQLLSAATRLLLWNSPPHAVRSKAKANFCICIQPPTLSCKRLNFKKREFSYFFWSTSKATNRHMRAARTRLLKEVTIFFPSLSQPWHSSI